MPLPKKEKGATLKTAAWGALIGVVALLFFGLNWGPVYTSNAANKLARASADAAVVRTLAPVCAAIFVKTATPEQSAALAKIESVWERGQFIEKIVKIPGLERFDYDVGRACAEALAKANTSAQK